jgi:hypothetical protein
MALLITSVACLLLIIAGGLLALLALEMSSQQKRKPRPKQKTYRISPHDTGAPSPYLKARLVNQLLNGNSRAATRLIRHARLKNPGRSEIWYVEKVIFDLERDRH